ncbi:acyltransferase domain-containing protein, partial [Streptomyces oceani]
ELLVECGVVGVSVAAVNGPESTVVSGSVVGLVGLVEVCEGRGVWVRWVEVDYASHSVQVEEIEEELREALVGLEPKEPEVP